MAKVRHLLHGIVRLNMRGTSPERFLNLCTLAGLNVWQVKKEQANLLFYMVCATGKKSGSPSAYR